LGGPRYSCLSKVANLQEVVGRRTGKSWGKEQHPGLAPATSTSGVMLPRRTIKTSKAAVLREVAERGKTQRTEIKNHGGNPVQGKKNCMGMKNRRFRSEAEPNEEREKKKRMRINRKGQKSKLSY